ncbi:MAG: hypothetical protein U0136_18035 [Bdellovibrionota bacterium]
MTRDAYFVSDFVALDAVELDESEEDAAGLLSAEPPEASAFFSLEPFVDAPVDPEEEEDELLDEPLL